MANESIDAIDRSILRTLVAEGKIKNKDLAERVALSASPCWQRVRRLEEEGYITGYSAILDPERLGAPDTVFVEIQMDKHDAHHPEELGAALAALDEVLEIHLTTGSYDYILKVAVYGTKGFEEFIRGKLSKISGIRHSRSSFALKCLKRAQVHIPD
ncbi:MAG: Lrp/AsnC family transcriptional regulator [Motiliproteus sp.]